MAEKIRRGIIFVLVSFLVSLGVIEIILRLFFPQYSTFTQPDPLLGYSFVPGAYYVFTPPEGCPTWGSSGYVNSDGLIDSDHDRVAPAGTYRILALGDSYTEALQFERESRWTNLLQTELNSNLTGSETYEVIDSGRSGMGTTLEYLYYRDRGRLYKPDLTILVFVTNDFDDNSAKLVPDMRPYYVLDANNNLVLDDSFKTNPGYQATVDSEWARQHFYLVALVRAEVSRLRQQAIRDQLQAQTAKEQASSPSTNTGDSLRQARIDAVNVTERVLLELDQTVKNDGGKFVFVIGTVPNDDTWLPIVREMNPDTPDITVDGALEQYAQAHDITTLNLVPRLTQYAIDNNTGLHGCAENGFSGHWNREGHRLVSEWIYDFLVENGLV